MSPDPNLDLLGRMRRAVEKVKDRLGRATKILNKAGIPYAVIGGSGVAAWVATVDGGAVRNTPDVDILLDRNRLDGAKRALEAEGFIFRHVRGVDMFLDGPGADPRDAVRIVFASEKIKEDDPVPAPRTDESGVAPGGLQGSGIDPVGPNEAHQLSHERSDAPARSD